MQKPLDNYPEICYLILARNGQGNERRMTMENYENRFYFTARYSNGETIGYPADTPEICVNALAFYAADPDCVFFEAYDITNEDPTPFLSYVRPQ